MASSKLKRRKIRKMRSRKKLMSTPERPRMSVYRSNRHIYAQVIDDAKSITLAAASDLKLKDKKTADRAKKVGARIARTCRSKKIKEVVFDRSGFKYSGLIKVLAEEARKSGLKF